MARSPSEPLPASGALPRTWQIPVALAIVVFIAFARSIGGDFIWDDDIHVLHNPLFRPFDLGKFVAAWTGPHESLYIPLSYTVWGLISLVGTISDGQGGSTFNPDLFHLVNLLLHAGNAILVFQILRRTLREDWAGLMGAFIFALHPLQVESVAWISGLRDLLSATCCLSALAVYLTRDRDRLGTAGLVQLLLLLGLLAKPSVAPMVIVVWLWGVLSDQPTLRIARQRFILLLPILCVSIGLLLFTGRLQKNASLYSVAPLQRPIVAIDTLGWYLQATIAPVSLCIDYGRTPGVAIAQFPKSIEWVLFLFALGLAIVFRRFRAVPFGLAMFAIVLSPVLGLTPFLFQRFSTVADRYAYLALLPIALMAGAIALRLPLRARTGTALTLAAVLFILTFRQTTAWKDNLSLYQHTLNVNPYSLLALNNLGTQYVYAGRIADALPLFERAVKAHPRDELSRENYAATLDLAGDKAGAARERAAAERARKRP